MAGMLESLCDIRHEVHLDHGGVPQKLSAIADKCDVDLIVIGSHGFQGIRKLLLGSHCRGNRPFGNAPRVDDWTLCFRRAGI